MLKQLKLAYHEGTESHSTYTAGLSMRGMASRHPMGCGWMCSASSARCSVPAVQSLSTQQRSLKLLPVCNCSLHMCREQHALGHVGGSTFADVCLVLFKKREKKCKGPATAAAGGVRGQARHVPAGAPAGAVRLRRVPAAARHGPRADVHAVRGARGGRRGQEVEVLHAHPPWGRA